MAKPDWGALQHQFLVEHVESGISPKEWCEQQGLVYDTARRHIKKSAQKSAQVKDAQSAQIAQKRAPKSAKKNPEKIAQKIIPDNEEDIFDPDEFGLSGKEGIFAEEVARGAKLIEAYRKAGYSDDPKTAYAQASKMVRKHNISRAIRWLRDRRQKRLALTEAELIHQLSSIASMDPNAFSQIRRVNCRYCWGDNHQYQWRDVDEYERACASALAESKAPPSFEGGVGFVNTTVPNEDCPRCAGEGLMETFFPETTSLDGPERWGYLGVEVTMNGLKVKIASPEAARRELLRIVQANRGRLPAGDPGDPPDKEELELERLRLGNEKLRAEIERIKTGDKEGNLVVVHNSLQVPGAFQPAQEDFDEGDG